MALDGRACFASRSKSAPLPEFSLFTKPLTGLAHRDLVGVVARIGAAKVEALVRPGR